MKKHFPGYFYPSKREIKNLWNSCVFAVDANILLNLYRYSDDTRNEFLRILDSIKDRLWLPHRAAQEYFNNRLSVIAQQEKAYDETIKTLENVQNDLQNARQHPFVSEKLLRRLTTVFEDVSKELLKNKDIHSKRAGNDKIQEALETLFENRVGDPFNDDKLESITKEGEERYAKKIPPGYKDGGKNNEGSLPDSGYRKYGDLIVWNQLAEKSLKTKKGLIFINDDKKEDWWQIFKGKNLGPRPELIKEFNDLTRKRFYMYQSDRFLELAAEHFKQALKPESVDEIRDLRRQDILKHNKFIQHRLERKKILIQREELNEKRIFLSSQLEMLKAKMNELEYRNAMAHEQLPSVTGSDIQSIEHHIDFQRKMERTEMEIQKIKHDIQKTEMEHRMIQEMCIQLEDEHRTRRST